MNRERRPRNPMEAQQMFVRGNRSPEVVRALPMRPRLKPVIAESEARIYVDVRLNDLLEDAKAAGFHVGGRPKAVEAMREYILKNQLPRKYMIVPD